MSFSLQQQHNVQDSTGQNSDKTYNEHEQPCRRFSVLSQNKSIEIQPTLSTQAHRIQVQWQSKCQSIKHRACASPVTKFALMWISTIENVIHKVRWIFSGDLRHKAHEKFVFIRCWSGVLIGAKMSIQTGRRNQEDANIFESSLFSQNFSHFCVYLLRRATFQVVNVDPGIHEFRRIQFEQSIVFVRNLKQMSRRHVGVRKENVVVGLRFLQNPAPHFVNTGDKTALMQSAEKHATHKNVKHDPKERNVPLEMNVKQMVTIQQGQGAQEWNQKPRFLVRKTRQGRQRHEVSQHQETVHTDRLVRNTVTSFQFLPTKPPHNLDERKSWKNRYNSKKQGCVHQEMQEARMNSMLRQVIGVHVVFDEIPRCNGYFRRQGLNVVDILQ